MRHASCATAARPGRRSIGPRTFPSCGSPRRRGRWPAPETRRGFTLVELLVVISIIAVLASLILPGVMNARRSARRAQCLNNMKQLGIAFVDYYTTHNVFPASGRIDLDPSGTPDPYPINVQEQLDLTAPTLAFNRRNYPKEETSPPEANPGGMRYSWVREMLPRLDRSDIYDLWDTSDIDGYGTYLDTGVAASGKRAPMSIGGTPGLTQTEIRVLVCPEDITAQPGKGNLSYVVNGGVTPHYLLWPDFEPIGDFEEAGWIRENFFRMGLMAIEGYQVMGGERQKYGRKHTTTSVRDGLTTTVMLSENINVGFNEGVSYLGSANLVEEVNWACPHPFNTSFFLQSPLNESTTGGVIVVKDEPETAYRYGDANTRGVASGGINGDLTGLNESQSPYPSSFHVGGVQIMMCDGSVRFMSDAIDGRVWARLVTPDGGRIAGPSEGRRPVLMFEDLGGNTQIPIAESEIP